MKLLAVTLAVAAAVVAGGLPRERPLIEVSGRQVLINKTPVHLKAVNWNPIPKGTAHPWGLDYAGFVVRDADLMVAAGINCVRTYEPLTDRYTLDQLYARGIYVVNTVYPYGGNPADSVIAPITLVMDHPAILMWAVGNEWNYNGLYVGLSFEEARERVRQVVDIVKTTDHSRPVTTIFGEVPDAYTVQVLANVDVWGLNIYSGISFDSAFDRYAGVSSKPMYLGEYGADAWNTNIAAEDQAAQAQATTQLTQEIVAHSTVYGGVCMGGFIFEWADEWWKAGNDFDHDTGGIAPGGGPYPDATFNEEWWGLVDIDRNPRQAYYAYQAVATP